MNLKILRDMYKWGKPYVQDNAGSGSPSDTTWLLKAAVDEQMENAAIGILWDPKAAEKAHEAGECAHVRILILQVLQASG